MTETDETFLEAQSESIPSLSQILVDSRATDEFWNVFLPHWSQMLCGYEREEEEEQEMGESWQDLWIMLVTWVLDKHHGIVVACAS